jgi:outer membrane protein assembly factor BamD (BamD/ComL family)
MNYRRINSRYLFVLAAVLLLLGLVGCQTVPNEVPEGLSQMEIFQLAQEAADNDNWDVARHYYETFLERYPEDWPNRIAARYEVAFTYYKEGELETAERMFENVLAVYEDPDARPLPAWPRVLSERLIQIIAEEQAQGQPRMFGGEPREEA